MQIDLGPHEYKAEQRAGEPLFGDGWPFGLAVLVMILIAAFTRDASTTTYFAGAIIGAIFGGIIHQFYR